MCIIITLRMYICFYFHHTMEISFKSFSVQESLKGLSFLQTCTLCKFSVTEKAMTTVIIGLAFSSQAFLCSSPTTNFTRENLAINKTDWCGTVASCRISSSYSGIPHASSDYCSCKKKLHPTTLDVSG